MKFAVGLSSKNGKPGFLGGVSALALTFTGAGLGIALLTASPALAACVGNANGGAADTVVCVDGAGIQYTTADNTFVDVNTDQSITSEILIDVDTPANNTSFVDFDVDAGASITDGGGDSAVEIRAADGLVTFDSAAGSSLTADGNGQVALRINVDDGTVIVNSNSTMVGTIDGINVFGDDADVTVNINADGSITGVTGDDGVDILTDITSEDTKDVVVNVYGDIGTSVNAVGDDGVVVRDTAQGNVSVSVASTGTIYSTGESIRVDVNENDDLGDVTINVAGALDSNGNDTIDVRAGDGLVTIATTAGGSLNADQDGIRVEKDDGDKVDIDVGETLVAGDQGVEVIVDEAPVEINTTAAITAQNEAIRVDSGNDDDDIGTVTVDVAAALVSNSDDGIEINADDGTVTVTTRTGGTIDATDGDLDNAIEINTDEGDVNITVGDKIDTFADGVQVVTETGDVDITTLAGALSDPNASAIGGEIDAGGGDSDRGIVVDNNFGNTTIVANAKITANDGIVVLADGGNTDVTMNADILADDFGIAVDYDDDGFATTEVVNVTTAAGKTITSNEDGIFVDGDDGKVTVLVNGRIDSAGTVVDPGDSGDGIDVNTDAGDIDITLNAGDGIQPSGIRSDLDGIKANSSDANDPDLDGNVTIVANASVEAGLSGIRVEDGEIVSVDVGGGATVTGLGTTANAVVDLTADLGLTFNNFGTVNSNGADEVTQAADVAVDFEIDSIGDDNDIIFATLNNDGTITGRFDGSDVSDTFNNNSPNTWTFTGISDFEGGIDTFNNNSAGRVVNAIDFTSAETAQYISLENYVNSGEVSLVDQLPGDPFVRDRAYTDGDYIGNGGTISLDADLSQDSPDSDRFIIGGDATDTNGSGTTLVSINRIDQGEGGFTPLGIPVIEISGDVQGANFKLANGPIDTGFFTYDLYFTDDASPYTDGDAPGLENLANTNLGEDTNETIAINNLWVLASTLNQNAYGLPHVVAGANNLWNVSTGTWLERTADLRLGFAQGMIGDAATVNGLTLGADLAPEEAPVAPPVAMSTLRPGAWFKVYGGHDSRDVTATQSVLGGAGSVRFNDNIDQDYFGALGGIDTVVDAGPSAAWIFGIYGGYGHSSLDFDSGVSIDFEAASVGAYATYLNAGFFFDALFKADFGTADYNATASAGSFDTDYQSLGGVLDTGYRFDNANWFFEPKATLSYVSTDVDDAKGFGLPVSFDDGESLRGRLGARLGTSFVSGAAKWEPFVEASYWNEFSGDYAATISSAGTDVPVNYDAGGSYTEMAVGLNAIEIGGGWSAFAKGNFQFGEDDYTGQTYQGGIRFSF